MMDDWIHPRDVIHDVSSPVVQAQAARVVVGNLTTMPGDRLLVCVRLQDTNSGYRLASDFSTGNTLPDNSVDQFFFSAHALLLGNSTNGIQSVAFNQGKGSAMFLWIDRGNVNNCKFSGASSSDENVWSGIIDNSVIAGAFSLNGTDVGIGTKTYTLETYQAWNRNPIIITRFPAGVTVPNAAFIDLMLEWMWHEWVIKGNRILYPPLREYL